MTEELIRVPLIVRPPAGATWSPGTPVDTMVRTVDVAPTILDYAGMTSDGPVMDGRSMRPLVEGRDDPPRTAFISGVWWGIVHTGRWKYRLEKPSWTGGDARHVLFDLVADPHETTDVADAHPAVLADLQQRWTDLAARLRQRAGPGSGSTASGDAGLDEENRRALEALGYLADDDGS
jgi:arylsulfatase A-like enzyme